MKDAFMASQELTELYPLQAQGYKYFNSFKRLALIRELQSSLWHSTSYGCVSPRSTIQALKNLL
jgi:hypothetical protein